KLMAKPEQKNEKEKMLFRFVQWNDMHVVAKEKTSYPLANEKMSYLADSLRNETHFPVPDFVIAVGDMIHGIKQENFAPDLKKFMELKGKLPCQFYPAVGNHENLQREGQPKYEGAYWDLFGKDHTNYTFEHGGILFIIINDSGAPSSNQMKVGKTRKRWLNKVLKKSGNQPKIICCHIPLIPVREEKVLKKSFGFSSYAAHDKETLAMVDKYSKSILAVLSGHLHLTGVVERKGVYHIVPSGTASHPCDFASFEVYADHVRVQMHGLPEKFLKAGGGIHGKKRHKIDYTDKNHATHELYLKGNPSERDFQIPLPTPLKRSKK
ncbi:hypothetical protein MNBD_PLANCTO02-107, partial [hydrothermal vent metagenome]